MPFPVVVPSFYQSSYPTLVDASNTYVDNGYDGGTTYYQADQYAPTQSSQQSTGLVYAYFNPATNEYTTDPCAGCQPAVWDPETQQYYVLPDANEATKANPAAPPPPSDPYTFYDTKTQSYTKENCGESCVPVVYDPVEGKYFTTGESSSSPQASTNTSTTTTAGGEESSSSTATAEDETFRFFNVDTNEYTMDSCGDACIPVRYDAASGNYVTDEGSQGNGLEDDEDSTTLVDDYTFLLGFANLTNFNNETQYTIFAPTNVAVIDAMNTTYRNFIEIAFNGEKNVTGADVLDALSQNDARMRRLRRVLLHSIAPSILRIQGLGEDGTSVGVLCGPDVEVYPAANSTDYASVGGGAVLLGDIPVATGLMSIIDSPVDYPYDPEEVDAWTCLPVVQQMYPDLQLL